MRKTLVVLILLPFAGCGVREYEAELEKTRERLVYLDKETELLAAPVAFPPDAPRLRFRPPKGFASQPVKIADQGGEWLSLSAAAGNGPFGLFVGFPSGKATNLEDWVKGFLKAQGAAEIQARAIRLDPVVRLADLPEQRKVIEYRLFGLSGEETPSVNGKPLAQPLICHYDVYSHHDQGLSVVIVLRRVNRRATEERWQGASDRPPAELIPADDVDKKLNEAIPFSLATLRWEPR